MTSAHRLYVGTIGEGLWRSLDGGETFTRACDGVFVECHVAPGRRSARPADVVSRHGAGLFRSERRRGPLEPGDVPLDGVQIWSDPAVARGP